MLSKRLVKHLLVRGFVAPTVTTSLIINQQENVAKWMKNNYVQSVQHSEHTTSWPVFKKIHPFLQVTQRHVGSTATMSSSVAIFRQMFEAVSSTYTYLLGDAVTKEAIIIDPVYETIERDVQIINELGLKLIYAANTHVHADHVTGTGLLKKRIPLCKSIISEVSKAEADVYVGHGDRLNVGNLCIEVRSTPGHTDGCVTYVCHEQDVAFTGDALLIRGCGRTDFQQGDAARLYDSVHEQILSLPLHTKLYPAHDYKGLSVTTVAEEKSFNPRLTKTKKEFVDIMNNLNLAYPKQIDLAVPSNIFCGHQELVEEIRRSQIEKAKS